MKTLREMKTLFQANLDDNTESLAAHGVTSAASLKAYLIESGGLKPAELRGQGKWKSLDKRGWLVLDESQYQSRFFLDATDEPVWKLYSIHEAVESDALVKTWIRSNRGLDHCWLSRKQLLYWQSVGGWTQKGIGLTFADGLLPEERQAYFSLKAWYGEREQISGLGEILNRAKEVFAIHSVRWQKSSRGVVTSSSEWYSNGKVTFGTADDVDDALLYVSDAANRYSDALAQARELRDTRMAAFELDFSQRVDLEAFGQTVRKGAGSMQLWLVEVEQQPDFRRFRGVDLHTWDRVTLDLGTDFLYLTVPADGCVNAVPRLAAIQGEDNAGRTEILCDGVELFA
jgi:hypothetical protein